ncbi:putative nucleotidyltransferase substrate binding domain-containing protein, partial [Oleiphilus sp. HI0117]
NHLNPDELSPLLRHQLKSAFSVVAESQRLLKMRFGHGSI